MSVSCGKRYSKDIRVCPWQANNSDNHGLLNRLRPGGFLLMVAAEGMRQTFKPASCLGSQADLPADHGRLLCEYPLNAFFRAGSYGIGHMTGV